MKLAQCTAQVASALVGSLEPHVLGMLQEKSGITDFLMAERTCLPPSPEFDLHVHDQAVQLSERNPLLVFYFTSMSVMAPKIIVEAPPTASEQQF